MNSKKRCSWAQNVPTIYEDYHDHEWGIPVHDDQHLFEMLILEGFQAGLSWLTILKKRRDFQIAFDGFDATVMKDYDDKKIEECMQNKAIVRNRRKIEAAVLNANVFLEIQQTWGSFDAYLWHFTDGKVIYDHNAVIPTSTSLSDEISKDLKAKGMKFVGTTIIYAYLQAVGVVHSHEKDCYLYQEDDS